MSIFDKLGKKVEEATQIATKKSGELVEITKLSTNIKSEEQNIKRLYEEIGRTVYENSLINSELYSHIGKFSDEIQESQSEINSLKARLRELKNIKLCQNCNSEVSSSSSFCDQCGEKLDD